MIVLHCDTCKRRQVIKFTARKVAKIKRNLMELPIFLDYSLYFIVNTHYVAINTASFLCLKKSL